MKPTIYFSVFALLSFNQLHAQEACKVALPELSGTYSGECKDGKANGQGKAVGTDTYEGQFKKGYPDGEGTYTWANKDVFTGHFKKGNMDGQGKLTFKSNTAADSTITGFWKKNKYIGLYEKPYSITDRTSKVNRAEVMLLRDDEKSGSININATQLSGRSSSAMPILPSITDITVLSGQYITKNSSNLTASTVTRLQQIIFPFRARFSFSNGEMIEISFNQKADYEVNISFL